MTDTVFFHLSQVSEGTVSLVNLVLCSSAALSAKMWELTRLRPPRQYCLISPGRTRLSRRPSRLIFLVPTRSREQCPLISSKFEQRQRPNPWSPSFVSRQIRQLRNDLDVHGALTDIPISLHPLHETVYYSTPVACFADMFVLVCSRNDQSPSNRVATRPWLAF